MSSSSSSRRPGDDTFTGAADNTIVLPGNSSAARVRPHAMTFITLVSGSSPKVSVRLRPGVPVPTFSIGTGAQWQVMAPGVAPLHFFLCFDGESLFASSALGAPPVMLGEVSLSSRWSKVVAPCDLSFGEARLFVERKMVPKPLRALAPEVEPGSEPNPLAGFGGEPGPGRRFSSSTLPMAQPTSPPSIAPATSGDDNHALAARVGRPARRPKVEAPPARLDRDATVPLAALSPLVPTGAMLAAHFNETIVKPIVLVPPPAQAAQRTPPPPASTSLDEASAVIGRAPDAMEDAPASMALPGSSCDTAPGLTGNSPSVVDAPGRAQPQVRRTLLLGVAFALACTMLSLTVTMKRRAAAAAQVVRPAVASPLPSASSSARAAVAPAPSATPPEGSPSPPADATPGDRTLERRAADAVALGSFGEAARLYDRLAQEAEGPRADVFRAASRIAQRKQGRPP
ncbi:MAG: hypothetical protein MUF34_09280 [Polyangiaceae bacterium]|nr:hypothetical protein [Polyangiaceae bacterium]